MRMNKKTIAHLLFLLGLLAGIGRTAWADGTESIRLPYTPWSGYWWPVKHGGLATGAAIYMENPLTYYADWKGGLSPYEKYGQIFEGDGRSRSWNYEYENHYNPDAPAWWGHCNGWAAAAAYETAPAAPGEMASVFLRVGDKKGLLTELHQSDASLLFGKRYNGNEGDDLRDIPAELFHTLLIRYLKDWQLPLIIEIDPGVEVWNYPCFGYDMEWVDSEDGGTPLRTVKTKVYLADDLVDPDNLTPVFFTLVYRYKLVMDNGRIVSGEWLPDSSNPDFMWEVLPGNQFSANPYLEREKVLQMVESVCNGRVTDDDREENDSEAAPALLTQRSSLLRALDPDFFHVPVEAGEKISITIRPEKLDTDISCFINNPQGEELFRIASQKSMFKADLPAALRDGNLLLGVLPQTAQTNHRNYQIVVDRTGTSYFMPHLVNDDGWWNKVFIFNRDQQTASPLYHFYQTGNDSVQKISYPAVQTQIQPGEVLAGEMKDIFTGFDKRNDLWLKIRCEEMLEGLFLFQNQAVNSDLASVPLLKSGQKSLTLNHLAVVGPWWTGISLANTSASQKARVTLLPYTQSGLALRDSQYNCEIPGGGRFISLVDQIPGFSADVLEQIGWIDITADQDLAGYALYGTKDMTLLEGLALDAPSANTLYLPYIPSEEGRWTGIALLNTGIRWSSVWITPYNKYGVNAYGPSSGHRKNIVLQGYEKYVRHVHDIFPEPVMGPVAWLKIESEYPVKGFSLSGSFSGSGLTGIDMVPDESFQTDGVLLAGKAAVIGANLLPNSSNVQLTFTACDKSGQILGNSKRVSVPFRSIVTVKIDNLFGREVLERASYIEWSSTGRILVIQELQDSQYGKTMFYSLKQ